MEVVADDSVVVGFGNALKDLSHIPLDYEGQVVINSIQIILVILYTTEQLHVHSTCAFYLCCIPLYVSLIICNHGIFISFLYIKRCNENN